MKIPLAYFLVSLFAPVLAVAQLPMSVADVDANTVALWHFDEGTGNTLYDASPYHNDGTIHNGTWVPGKFGSALHFDGLTSYVNIPNSASLKPQNEFTIEAWFSFDTLQFASVNPPALSGATLLCNYGLYPNGGGYGLGFWTSGLMHFDYRATDAISHTTPNTTIQQSHTFYHAAVTYKRMQSGPTTVTVIRTYLNGALTDSSVYAGEIQYSSTPSFYFGTEIQGRAVGGPGVREFPGIIDEVRISNIARLPGDFDINPNNYLPPVPSLTVPGIASLFIMLMTLAAWMIERKKKPGRTMLNPP